MVAAGRAWACVVVVVAALASADGAAPAPAARATTWADRVGDVVGGGPDIGAVTVSNDERGLISLEIKTPNRPSLRDDDNIQIYVDVDGNRASGLDGAERRVLLLGLCDVSWCPTRGERNVAVLQSLNARGYFSGAQKLAGRFASGAWRVSVEPRDLKSARVFNLALIARDPSPGSRRNSDEAPDGFPAAFWRYEVSSGPSASVSLASASFAATWHESRVRGTLVVSGRSATAAGVDLTLATVAGGKVAATWRRSVAAGAFKLSLKLPAALLPGTYRLRVAVRGGGGRAAATRTVVLRAPREGVVVRAYAAAVRHGPAATRLGGKRNEVWAYFVFAAQPRVAPITVRWYAPNRMPQPLAGKANDRVIETAVKVVGGNLAPGVWTCVLSAGGVVVKRLTVRIG